MATQRTEFHTQHSGPSKLKRRDQSLGKQTGCHLQEHTKVESCLEMLCRESMGSPESHLGRARVYIHRRTAPNVSHVAATMNLRVEHKGIYLSEVKDVYTKSSKEYKLFLTELIKNCAIIIDL